MGQAHSMDKKKKAYQIPPTERITGKTVGIRHKRGVEKAVISKDELVFFPPFLLVSDFQLYV
jgi:hypothetical protein